MKNERRPDGYWRVLARKLRKNRVATAAFFVIIGIFAVAAVADFIANDKPLVMSYKGKIYFPVLKDYAVRIGLSRWDRSFQNVVFNYFFNTTATTDNYTLSLHAARFLAGRAQPP